MARYDSKKKTLHGRVGNLIHYTRNGVEYVRQKPDYSQWRVSPGSQAAVNAFRQVSLYFKFLPAELVDVWRAAARGTVRNCRTHFMHMNFGAFPFEGEEPVPYFERLAMSDGRVPLPLGMKMGAAEEEGVWRLTWDAELALPRAAADDVLWVVEIHTATPRQVNLVGALSARRGEGACTFRLRSHLGGETHLYCFFADAARTHFSPSRYFRVDGSMRRIWGN